MQTRLELWQLCYFVAVAEELSFRRAAERLAITQPPLTRQIQALEAGVGMRLLERGRHGVMLTPAGEDFLGECRALLESADAMLARVREKSRRCPELRLGMTTVVDTALFEWLEGALRERVPELRLMQKRQISQHCIADVRRGLLDAAIIGLPSATFDLQVERLCDDPLMVALPTTHPLCRRRRISLLELRDDPLFWFSRHLNPAYYDHCEVLFRKLNFNPLRLPEPTDHHILLGLIATGAGIALIPSSMKRLARPGVSYKVLKEEGELQIGLGLVYPAGLASPMQSLLLSSLKAHYRAADSANA